VIIHAKIAGEIEVAFDALPEQVRELSKTATTVWNEDRQKKLDEKVWGAWDEPEWVPLWREERRRGGEHVMLFPRGFAAGFYALATSLGHEVAWEDARSSASAAPGYYRPFVLRDYQLDAATRLLQAEQGVYVAPTGSGKTVTILGLLAYADVRAIVIVSKAGLLEQWRERAATYLGLSLDLDDEHSVGKIGEDVWVERDLTICLRQTLWARLWEIKATGWFSRLGATVIDECHALAGETLGEIVRESSTRLMLGASATPAKTETKGQIVYSLVGPVVAETPREALYARGVLVRPTVEVVYTGHDDVFWPTHDATPEQDEATGRTRWRCEVPDCRKSGKHTHRNNFATIQKRLVEDPDRARLIAERVVSERGHVHLIASRQLKHLEILRDACVEAGWDGPIFMLRGEENAEGLSQAIADAIVSGGHWETYEEKDGRSKVTKLRRVSSIGPYGREALVFSTVADEGLDVPPIDRVWIVFPLRQPSSVIQLIGRCERTSKGKTDAKVIDLADRCSVFAAQAEERQATYRMLGHEIKFCERQTA
jgi:superfamily II DNA or RNA helicase